MDAQSPASETKPLTHRETMLVVLGVLLPVFMGSLDNTILASALPTIGREFGDVHNLPWLITAYLIANTAITALYGKISDIRGRRVTLMIAISMYMLGSLVCALAPNMFVLILGRVLHGLGGGGLTSTGMVVLGDIAAPKDRGKYYGYFSATYTTAGACGPALGGAIAQYLHWSVIFWMNIPLGLIAMTLTLTLLRRLPRRERPHRLDFLGALLIMTASVAFMLALSMGGVRHPWTSPPILVAVRGRAAGRDRLHRAAAHRARAADPAGDPRRPRGAARGHGQRLRLGTDRRPAHLPAGVPAERHRHAAVDRGPQRADAGGHAQRQRRRNRHGSCRGGSTTRRIPIAGLLLAIASVLLLAWRAKQVTLPEFEVLLFLIGIGFGTMPPLAATALQNNVSIHTFGSAVATMQFSRNLYATMIVAVFGAIVLMGTGGMGTGGMGTAAHYSVEGFVWVFIAVAGSFAVALAAVLLMEEKPLLTAHI